MNTIINEGTNNSSQTDATMLSHIYEQMKILKSKVDDSIEVIENMMKLIPVDMNFCVPFGEIQITRYGIPEYNIWNAPANNSYSSFFKVLADLFTNLHSGYAIIYAERLQISDVAGQGKFYYLLSSGIESQMILKTQNATDIINKAAEVTGVEIPEEIQTIIENAPTLYPN